MKKRLTLILAMGVSFAPVAFAKDPSASVGTGNWPKEFVRTGAVAECDHQARDRKNKLDFDTQGAIVTDKDTGPVVSGRAG